jgi:hypothetical protein
VNLDRETIALLADALADRLEERRHTVTPWVTADVVAEHLSVDRDFVYEHADELGARRLGAGPKARLRFRLDLVDEALSVAGRESGEPPARMAAPSRRRRPTTSVGTGVPLLPIRGVGSVR